MAKHTFTWTDQPGEKPGEQKKVPSRPALIRRLGKSVLSAERSPTAELFAKLAGVLAPLIVGGEASHRVKTLAELFIEIASDDWVMQAQQRHPSKPAIITEQLRSSLYPSAADPQRVTVGPKVVKSGGQARFGGQADGLKGCTKLRLVLEGPRVVDDLRAARRWASQNGISVPAELPLLTMDLLAPTGTPYLMSTLSIAVNRVKQILSPGIIIPVGEVVLYDTVFDGSGQLLPQPQ